MTCNIRLLRVQGHSGEWPEWVSDVIAGMVKWSELQTTGPDVKVERVSTLTSMPISYSG